MFKNKIWETSKLFNEYLSSDQIFSMTTEKVRFFGNQETPDYILSSFFSNLFPNFFVIQLKEGAEGKVWYVKCYE